MKKILFLLGALIHCAFLQAQSLGMQQLGSIGGQIGSGGPVLTHALGGVASTVIDNGSNRLDQGMFLACDIACDPGKVGIDDLIYQNPLLSFSPNPAHEVIRLQGESQYIHRYELFSTTGQLVSAGLVQENQISLHDHPNGLYLLRVYGRQGELSYIGKAIKE